MLFMKHEREVLTNITNARAKAMSATGINDRIDAENQLSGALAGSGWRLRLTPT
jgi:LemA protein